jgi:hypothetical protein
VSQLINLSCSPPFRLILKMCTAALFATFAGSCTPSVLCGSPTSFRYASISTKRIAYGVPVVVSSEIFYENRFTNQSYHSIDNARTRDAFFRDFGHALPGYRLSWITLPAQIDSLIQTRFAFNTATVDTLSPEVLESLRKDSVDVVVLVYAGRLYHGQMVGLRPEGATVFRSYGTVFVKRLDYVCSVFDVSCNRALWQMPVHLEENSDALGLFENSLRQLFHALLR